MLKIPQFLLENVTVPALRAIFFSPVFCRHLAIKTFPAPFFLWASLMKKVPRVCRSSQGSWLWDLSKAKVIIPMGMLVPGDGQSDRDRGSGYEIRAICTSGRLDFLFIAIDFLVSVASSGLSFFTGFYQLSIKMNEGRTYFSQRLSKTRTFPWTLSKCRTLQKDDSSHRFGLSENRCEYRK